MDFFKKTEELGRSVTTQVQSEREINLDLGGIPKKYSIRYQLKNSLYSVSTKNAF